MRARGYNIGMKTFKFKYSITVWILLSLVLCLSIGGLAWNVWGAIEYLGLDTTKMISSFLTSALCLLLAVVCASVMLFGKYVVGQGAFVCCFGLIKSKYDIKDITAIILFKKSNRLVMYFGQKKYSVVLIDDSCYQDFVLAVREQNKEVVYDVKIEGEDTPN